MSFNSTYSESFGIYSILDQGDAVAERLAVEIGVLSCNVSADLSESIGFDEKSRKWMTLLCQMVEKILLSFRIDRFPVWTYKKGGDFVEDVDCFAGGFLLRFGIAGRGVRWHCDRWDLREWQVLGFVL